MTIAVVDVRSNITTFNFNSLTRDTLRGTEFVELIGNFNFICVPGKDAAAPVNTEVRLRIARKEDTSINWYAINPSATGDDNTVWSTGDTITEVGFEPESGFVYRVEISGGASSSGLWEVVRLSQ